VTDYPAGVWEERAVGPEAEGLGEDTAGLELGHGAEPDGVAVEGR
jgi:hypothetical protein